MLRAIVILSVLAHGAALHMRSKTQPELEEEQEFNQENTMVSEPGAVNVILEDIFCWAVQGPGDAPLMAVARSRIKACGGMVILSNFSDPSKDVVQLFHGNMVTGLTPGGWANNTNLFIEAWKFIAQSEWPKKYTWFVKVDADTYFRPQKLPYILSKFNPTEPVALIQDGRVRGALEVMSSSSFTHPNSSRIYTRRTAEELDQYLGGEDVWLGWAFKKAGFRLAEISEAGKCTSFLLSYYNLPSSFKTAQIMTPGHVKNLPPWILQKACQAGPEYEINGCVSRSIIGIHPVKDPSVYHQFAQAEEQCIRFFDNNRSPQQKKLAKERRHKILSRGGAIR